MKKNLPWDVLYTNVLFGLFVQNLADSFASFRYRAWGFFEVPQVEYRSLVVILGVYPAFAILIVNLFPFKSRWMTRIAYLIGWSIFSTLYEWLAVRTGIIWHIHWDLYCSFILYPFIYYMLILQIRLHLWLKRLPDPTRERGL
ncbi:CBO0543 family protein [Paenibacillus yonginensis]|nr:CBO0543 family protein [Paenibacillus yonginensis]